MDPLWTHTAENDFRALKPRPLEFHQVNETLLLAASGNLKGVPIRWARFFFFKSDCLLIESGRFAIVYSLKDNRISVLAVRLAEDV